MGAGIAAAAGSILGTVVNNEYAKTLTRQDRAENYRYGEMAAENADRRTRALYGDFYSPEALLKQYKEAGLSPSMMYGGTPGQGGMSGAQGSGASGIQTPYVPMSILEAVQAANITANTKKTEAETKNIQQDTVGKIIANKIQDFFSTEKEAEFTILSSTWNDKDGKPTSLFKEANTSKSWQEFETWVKNSANERTKELISSEYGNKVLRRIYMDSNRYETEIKILSSESVNAEFQESLLKALKDKDFANLNAENAVQYLKTNTASNELTESQKQAWNDLLDRIGAKSETARDILIVISMIVDRFAGTVGASYTIPNGQAPAPHVTNNYVTTKQ